MTRVFRLALWFVLGFLASAVPLLSYAETVPATSSPRVGSSMWSGSNGSIQRAGTVPLAVCTAIWGSGTQSADLSAGKYYCKVNGAFMNGWPLSQSVVCTVGNADPGVLEGCSGNVYSCPPGQNWTLSGTTCTRPDCASGQIRDPATGLCIMDCNSAASKANTGQWFEGSGAMPSSMCIGGCGFSAPACVGFGGTNWGCQAGAGTGQNCSGAGVSQADAAKKACMEKGEGVGTINGITVCSGPATTTKTDGNKTTTTTNSGGTSSTTKTESTTCSGGTCTTTTSETSGSGTTTGSVQQDQNSFCQSNPTHLACKAQEEQKTECEKNPEIAGCKELGDPGTASNLSSEAKGVSSISVVSVASNASCPADIQLPKGMKFEWAPICQWAEALRPVVLAMAWLLAGIIVLGGSF